MPGVVGASRMERGGVTDVDRGHNSKANDPESDHCKQKYVIHVTTPTPTDSMGVVID